MVTDRNFLARFGYGVKELSNFFQLVGQDRPNMELAARQNAALCTMTSIVADFNKRFSMTIQELED